MRGSTIPPAAGFERVELGGTFASVNGPLYARWHGDRLQIGFRVGPAHVNPGQNCHGGMLCTFADILISTAAQYQADILRVTRNLVFSQGLVEADGEAVMRASGVFRRGPLLPESADDQALRLPGMPARVTRGG